MTKGGGGPIARGRALVKNPESLGGIPVFRSTRVPFQALLDYLEGGQKLDEFLDNFPTVTRETAIAALKEANAVTHTLCHPE